MKLTLQCQQLVQDEERVESYGLVADFMRCLLNDSWDKQLES